MSNISFNVDQNPKFLDTKCNQIIRDGMKKCINSHVDTVGTGFTIQAFENHVLVAGMVVENYDCTYHMKYLWVEDNYRGRGIGSELLQKLDDMALAKGITEIFTDTYSFQAPEFYQKHGYTIVCVVKEYIMGHDKIYLKKVFN